MSPEEIREPDDPADPLEALLVECIERIETEGRAAVERILKEHPEQAEALRSRLRILEDLELFDLEKAPAEEPSTRRLGDFRLIRLIGRGGMGEVHLAEQVSLKRLVALKVVRSGVATLPAVAARIRQEARAIARLRHPGIVGVHSVGEEQGVVYIAMELVPGRSLDAVVRNHREKGDRLPVADATRWARDIARALQCAHESGVVHRDVKPGNVQITPDGQAMLLDFGLARMLEEGEGTATRQFQGSPHYSSPEQVDLQRGPIGPRSDVFSLGATLYECVTGETASQGESTAQIFHQILSREPAQPRKKNPSVSRDLQTVILKAVEKDPESRYSSAGELAEDLDAVLGFRPIRAQPPGPVARLGKWTRRNPATAAGALVVLAAIVGVSGALGMRDGGRDAQPAYQPLMSEGIHLASLDRWRASFDVSPDGERIVFRIRRPVPEPGFRPASLVISDASGLMTRPLFVPADWSTEHADVPRWSPDGRLIAFAVLETETSQTTTSVFVVGPDPDGEVPRRVGPSFPRILDLCWKPDGSGILCLTPDGLFTLSLEAGERRDLHLDQAVQIPGLGSHSPDDRWLAFHGHPPGSSEGPESGTDIWILPAAGGEAFRVTDGPETDWNPAWAVDSRALYFSSNRGGDRNIWKLDLDLDGGTPRPAGEPQRVTSFNGSDILHPRVLPDGRMVFLHTRTRMEVHVEDASVLSVEQHEPLVAGNAPQLSPDGSLVYYRGETTGERGIFVAPRGGGTPNLLVAGTPGSALVFDLSPDGRVLAYSAMAGDSSGLFVVPTEGGEPRRLLGEPVTQGPTWSPDGSWLAYGIEGGLYVLPAAGGPPRELARSGNWAEPRWSPDGAHLAAFSLRSSEESALLVFPVAGGEARRLTPWDEYEEGLAWHPSGDRLTYVTYLPPTEEGPDSEVRQVSLDGGQTVGLINQEGHWDYAGIWADRTRFFFSTTDEVGPKISVYDQETGVHPTPFRRGAGSLPTFSADGKTMAWVVDVGADNRLVLMEGFR